MSVPTETNIKNTKIPIIIEHKNPIINDVPNPPKTALYLPIYLLNIELFNKYIILFIKKTYLNMSKAICIIGFPKNDNETSDDILKYKIFHTTKMISQIRKYYISNNEKIKIHLYKYCSKKEYENIKELLKLFKIENLEECDLYYISLDELFDILIEYFENNNKL